MPLGQGWLNAWVKVNSKHVVFPQHKDGLSSPKSGSNKTASTAVSEETRRSKKHRRRLTKTTSASDLIRQKAKTKVESIHDQSTTSKGENNGDASDTTVKASVAQHEDPSIVTRDTEGSLRFVAGFFGADIEALKIPASEEPFRGESASVKLPPRDSPSVASLGGGSLPTEGFRFPQNLFSDHRGRCKHCTSLEEDLASAREDLEYMRGVALRSEYICEECQTKQQPPKRTESKLMGEVIERHRMQMIELTKSKVSPNV